MKTESKKQFNEAENPKLDQSSLGLSALSFELKIGFDGKRAANNLTGLGNYSRSLIEQLANEFPANEYFIYAPRVKENIQKLAVFKQPNIHLVLPNQSKFLWRSIGIKKQLLDDQVELFHGLSHEIPFGIHKTGIKSIVTIHDLIFLRKPEYYQFIDRFIYKLKSKYACENADRIIAISEKTKEDIVDLYNIDPAKIEVIYQSCDDSFKKTASELDQQKIKDKYHLPAQFMLSVGTIEARKNLLVIIKALPKIPQNFKLVVIGKETAYIKLVKQEIEKLGLNDRVIFLQNIPFGDLPIIYQMAKVFVLPSYYEGFGIPIIEALFSKVPVIAATGSCLEEAGGPDSLYASPDDVEGFATAINTVIADERHCENMIVKGLAYVQKFNSKLVSEQLMDCYIKTLNK
ncbi:MAG: glycosyltransferase family 1 protein [Pedobacter sp.]|nr:MAG: glycosyltransferase family 1 protein [Pedobacter sp.]